jgi:hypothetical protein
VSDHTKASGSRSVTLTVPLHITFTLGVPGAGPTDAIATPARPGRGATGRSRSTRTTRTVTGTTRTSSAHRGSPRSRPGIGRGRGAVVALIRPSVCNTDQACSNITSPRRSGICCREANRHPGIRGGSLPCGNGAFGSIRDDAKNCPEKRNRGRSGVEDVSA